MFSMDKAGRMLGCVWEMTLPVAKVLMGKREIALG